MLLLALWYFVLAVGTSSLAIGAFISARGVKSREPRCPQCGYQAPEPTTVRCPECGHAPRSSFPYRHPPQRIRALFLGAAAVALPLFIIVRANHFDSLNGWSIVPTRVLAIGATSLPADSMRDSFSRALAYRITHGGIDLDAASSWLPDCVDLAASSHDDSLRAVLAVWFQRDAERIASEDPARVGDSAADLMYSRVLAIAPTVQFVEESSVCLLRVDALWSVIPSCKGVVEVDCINHHGQWEEHFIWRANGIGSATVVVPIQGTTTQNINSSDQTITIRGRSRSTPDSAWVALKEQTHTLKARSQPQSLVGIDSPEIRRAVEETISEGLGFWPSTSLDGHRFGFRLNRAATSGDEFDAIAIGIVIDVMEGDAVRRTTHAWLDEAPSGSIGFEIPREDLAALARATIDPTHWTVRIRGSVELAQRAVNSDPKSNKTKWWNGEFAIPLHIEQFDHPLGPRMWDYRGSSVFGSNRE
ncbi:MAG: hypothetical protein O2800_04955 [Planctomycetota bacterium]|nr:hypothetical protein [Planctomycetota bacterium]